LAARLAISLFGDNSLDGPLDPPDTSLLALIPCVRTGGMPALEACRLRRCPEHGHQETRTRENESWHAMFAAMVVAFLDALFVLIFRA
jgi:hypothetical protein